MRKILSVAVAVAAITFTGAAFAQSAGGVSSMQSSNPQGVQIQGNTNINASGQNINTTAVGQGNTAESAVGAIGGGTQIQGNTNINASAENVNTTAVGTGNSSKAVIGGIGK
ncbi:MAG: hypothetical protein HQL37_00590 [Alphaproteobacteria bacterium]|nr:hypothetical protein [Alphaproteobacteria bacterium]